MVRSKGREGRETDPETEWTTLLLPTPLHVCPEHPWVPPRGIKVQFLDEWEGVLGSYGLRKTKTKTPKSGPIITRFTV